MRIQISRRPFSSPSTVTNRGDYKVIYVKPAMTPCRPRRTVVPGNQLTLTLTMVAICLCSCCGGVSGSNRSAREVSPLWKRQPDDGFRLTHLQIPIIVDTYNALRNIPLDAADMRELMWDSDLVRKAIVWVGFCDKTRPPPKFLNQKTYLRTFVSYVPIYSTGKSFDEFNADTNNLFRIPFTCETGKKWKELMEITVAKSEKLACAQKYCHVIGGHDPNKRGHLVACLQFPTSQAKGLQYTRGKPCSKCPSRYNSCIGKICSRKYAKGMNTGTTHPPYTSVVVAMVTVVLSWILDHDIMT